MTIADIENSNFTVIFVLGSRLIKYLKNTRDRHGTQAHSSKVQCVICIFEKNREVTNFGRT